MATFQTEVIRYPKFFHCSISAIAFDMYESIREDDAITTEKLILFLRKRLGKMSIFVITVQIHMNYRFENLKAELLKVGSFEQINSVTRNDHAEFRSQFQNREEVERALKNIKIFIQNSEVQNVSVKDQKNEYFIKRSGAITSFDQSQLNNTSMFIPQDFLRERPKLFSRFFNRGTQASAKQPNLEKTADNRRFIK